MSPVDTATSFDFDEILRVCVAFRADHLANKIFKIWSYFRRDNDEILVEGEMRVRVR